MKCTQEQLDQHGIYVERLLQNHLQHVKELLDKHLLYVRNMLETHHLTREGEEGVVGDMKSCVHQNMVGLEQSTRVLSVESTPPLSVYVPYGVSSSRTAGSHVGIPPQTRAKRDRED
eukprot:PhF_6_TR9931/c0_g1_i1/m.15115